MLLVNSALVSSGLCALVVCGVNGRTGLGAPAAHVQSAEDSGDLLLQHEPYPLAMVTHLAGHRRSFQQGQWAKTNKAPDHTVNLVNQFLCLLLVW